MPNPIERTWGRTKPPPGTPLRRGGVAVGLRHSYTFAGAPESPRNDADGQIYAPSSAPSRSCTEYGAAAYATGGASAVEIPAAAMTGFLSTAWTWRLVFRARTWPGGFTTLWDDAARQFSAFLDTNGTLSFNLTSSQSWNLSAGSWWDVVLTRSDAQIVAIAAANMYINGVASGTVSAMSTSQISGTLCVGRNPSGGGSNADMDVALVQVWARALAANEVAALRADPWAAYAPPRPTPWFNAVTAATVVFPWAESAVLPPKAPWRASPY